MASKRGVGGEERDKPKGVPVDDGKGEGDGKEKGSGGKEAPNADPMKVDAGSEYTPSGDRGRESRACHSPR